VPLTPENLLAVAKLSTFGLADAILHPAPAKTLLNVVDRVFIPPHAQDFLGALEASFSKLPACVVTAILDLFRRPHRYESATDIACQAGITPKALENSMRSANLGAAKKLVILAKLLRACGYLRDSRYQVGRVCDRVGYSHRRIFAEHSRTVFGCSPSGLRSSNNPDEIVMSALEWFYKPYGRGALRNGAYSVLH
jgi:AraC-like DNA-binding protein